MGKNKKIPRKIIINPQKKRVVDNPTPNQPTGPSHEELANALQFIFNGFETKIQNEFTNGISSYSENIKIASLLTDILASPLTANQKLKLLLTNTSLNNCSFGHVVATKDTAGDMIEWLTAQIDNHSLEANLVFQLLDSKTSMNSTIGQFIADGHTDITINKFIDLLARLQKSNIPTTQIQSLLTSKNLIGTDFIGHVALNTNKINVSNIQKYALDNLHIQLELPKSTVESKPTTTNAIINQTTPTAPTYQPSKLEFLISGIITADVVSESKEEVFDYICRLPEQEKILALANCLNKNHPLYFLMAKQRGFLPTSKRTGTLKKCRDELTAMIRNKWLLESTLPTTNDSHITGFGFARLLLYSGSNEYITGKFISLSRYIWDLTKAGMTTNIAQQLIFGTSFNRYGNAIANHEEPTLANKIANLPFQERAEILNEIFASGYMHEWKNAFYSDEYDQLYNEYKYYTGIVDFVNGKPLPANLKIYKEHVVEYIKSLPEDEKIKALIHIAMPSDPEHPLRTFMKRQRGLTPTSRTHGRLKECEDELERAILKKCLKQEPSKKILDRLRKNERSIGLFLAIENNIAAFNEFKLMIEQLQKKGVSATSLLWMLSSNKTIDKTLAYVGDKLTNTAFAAHRILLLNLLKQIVLESATEADVAFAITGDKATSIIYRMKLDNTLNHQPSNEVLSAHLDLLEAMQRKFPHIKSHVHNLIYKALYLFKNFSQENILKCISLMEGKLGDSDSELFDILRSNTQITNLGLIYKRLFDKNLLSQIKYTEFMNAILELPHQQKQLLLMEIAADENHKWSNYFTKSIMQTLADVLHSMNQPAATSSQESSEDEISTGLYPSLPSTTIQPTITSIQVQTISVPPIEIAKTDIVTPVIETPTATTESQPILRNLMDEPLPNISISPLTLFAPANNLSPKAQRNKLVVANLVDLDFESTAPAKEEKPNKYLEQLLVSDEDKLRALYQLPAAPTLFSSTQNTAETNNKTSLTEKKHLAFA